MSHVYGLDQGLSPAWEPLYPCPLFPYLWGIVLLQGYSSVLIFSAVSSVGCWRLRTWYGGCPLTTSHQMPTRGQVESIQQSSCFHLPNAGMTVIHHCGQLTECWGWSRGFVLDKHCLQTHRKRKGLMASNIPHS